MNPTTKSLRGGFIMVLNIQTYVYVASLTAGCMRSRFPRTSDLKLAKPKTFQVSKEYIAHNSPRVLAKKYQ